MDETIKALVREYNRLAELAGWHLIGKWDRKDPNRLLQQLKDLKDWLAANRKPVNRKPYPQGWREGDPR